MTGIKIQVSPEFESLVRFDQENNFKPHRVTAERIAKKYGFGFAHPLVDEISHALEDAMDFGRKRGPLEVKFHQSSIEKGQ